MYSKTPHAPLVESEFPSHQDLSCTRVTEANVDDFEAHPDVLGTFDSELTPRRAQILESKRQIKILAPKLEKSQLPKLSLKQTHEGDDPIWNVMLARFSEYEKIAKSQQTDIAALKTRVCDLEIQKATSETQVSGFLLDLKFKVTKL